MSMAWHHRHLPAVAFYAGQSESHAARLMGQSIALLSSSYSCRLPVSLTLRAALSGHAHRRPHPHVCLTHAPHALPRQV
jgi:hypothetical protein